MARRWKSRKELSGKEQKADSDAAEKIVGEVDVLLDKESKPLHDAAGALGDSNVG